MKPIKSDIPNVLQVKKKKKKKKKNWNIWGLEYRANCGKGPRQIFAAEYHQRHFKQFYMISIDISLQGGQHFNPSQYFSSQLI